MRLRKYNKSLGWMSLIAGTVLLSGCDSALLDPKGQIGLEQRSLILTAFGLMMIVVIPAVLMAVGFAWKYRASNKDAKYSPNWSHSNKVEAVVWTVPILIILFLAVLTWKTTHALEPSKPLVHDEKPITIEARIACNGGHDLPILCKVFHGLSKKDEALLFAVQTGISTDLTAGERLRADIVAEDEDACAFVAATEATGATFALDGIRAEWKIYCIRSAYYIYKNYGSDIYQEALKIIVEAWWGDSDSFLSGILHGVTRFVAMYRDEYSRERLIARLSTVHPKTITKKARKDTGNTADRHMKQILEIYNGSSRSLSLPVKR